MVSFFSAALSTPEAMPEQSALYTIAFLLSSAAGIFRTIGFDAYESFGNLVAIGLSCGFIGLSCGCVVIGIYGSGSNAQPIVVGVAAVVGMMGKKVVHIHSKVAGKVIYKVASFLLSKAGIDIEEIDSLENNIKPGDKPVLPDDPDFPPK